MDLHFWLRFIYRVLGPFRYLLGGPKMFRVKHLVGLSCSFHKSRGSVHNQIVFLVKLFLILIYIKFIIVVVVELLLFGMINLLKAVLVKSLFDVLSFFVKLIFVRKRSQDSFIFTTGNSLRWLVFFFESTQSNELIF